jgi:uncharacterized protein
MMGDEIKVQERRAASGQNVDVVRSVYDAYGRGDVAAIFALFDTECVVQQSSRLPWGGTYRGHAGLGEFLGKLTQAVQSRVTTERYIDDEEGHVATIGWTRGTALATGRAFDVAETHIWTVAAGKVTKLEAYIDTAAMREALGL